MSLLAKIMGSTALQAPAAPADPAAPEPAASTDGMVTIADAQGAATEAAANGAKAEGDRYQAVLTSPGGQANASTALFMLKHNPSASAESIVAHLDTLKPAADAGTPAPAASTAPAAPAAAAPITVDLKNTPAVDLGGAGAGANNGGEPAADTESMWKASNEALLAQGGTKIATKAN
jgi:hypothetical protein